MFVTNISPPLTEVILLFVWDRIDIFLEHPKISAKIQLFIFRPIKRAAKKPLEILLYIKDINQPNYWRTNFSIRVIARYSLICNYKRVLKTQLWPFHKIWRNIEILKARLVRAENFSTLPHALFPLYKFSSKCNKVMKNSYFKLWLKKGWLNKFNNVLMPLGKAWVYISL